MNTQNEFEELRHIAGVIENRYPNNAKKVRDIADELERRMSRYAGQLQNAEDGMRYWSDQVVRPGNGEMGG